MTTTMEPATSYSDWDDYSSWYPSEGSYTNENTPVIIVNESPLYSEAKQDFMNVQCVCGTVRYSHGGLCKECLGSEIEGVRVTGEAFELMMSDVAVKERVWFHATRVEDWDYRLKNSGKTVHMGTKESALALMRGRDKYCLDNREPFFLYELVLDEDSLISPNTCPDLASDWQRLVSDLTDLTDSDFIRYVNSYEDAGSVSLIGNPNKMTVINCHKILPTDSKSLLTV